MFIVSNLRTWLRNYRMKKYAQCYKIDSSTVMTAQCFVNVMYPTDRIYLEVGGAIS